MAAPYLADVIGVDAPCGSTLNELMSSDVAGPVSGPNSSPVTTSTYSAAANGVSDQIMPLLLQQQLVSLRLVERLEEHVGRAVFEEQLVDEIVASSAELTRPRIPDEGEKKALNGYKRPAEVVRVAHICRLVNDADRVLDIGVGRGYVLASLFANAAPAHVFGVDISERLIAQTRLMIEANGIDADAVDLETLDVTAMPADYLNSRGIDLILMFEVLEHVSDPQRALGSIADAMSERELLVFSVPVQGRIEACWGHKTLFDSVSIQTMIAEAGLHLNWVEPVHNMWAVFAVSKMAARPDLIKRFSPLAGPKTAESAAMEFVPVKRTSSLHDDSYTTVKGCPDVVFDADVDRPCSFGTPQLAALRLELSFSPAEAVEEVSLECQDADGTPLATWVSRRLDRIDNGPRSFSFRPGWSDLDFRSEVLDAETDIRRAVLTVKASGPCKVRVHRAHFAQREGALVMPLAVTTAAD